jgi:hypothetical protein
MSDVTRYWVLNRLPLGVKEDVQALGYKKMVDSADYDAMKARAEAAEAKAEAYWSCIQEEMAENVKLFALLGVTQEVAEKDTGTALVVEGVTKLKARAEQAEQQVQSYRDSLDQVQRWRREEKDDIQAKLTQAQDTVTRLREALEGAISLLGKICFTEPELTQYRALKRQAQAALSAMEAGPKEGA